MKYKFTKRELKDLFLSWIIISLAFAILFSKDNFKPLNFIILFAFSLFSAGLGFLLHELMHKFVAQKYHLIAEYYANYNMLLISLLFSFVGFIIAAPGAVYISGRVRKSENGKISLAGPATNIILALFFLALTLIFRENIISSFMKIGLSINSWMAFFNLIPFDPFDGKKIYDWNKTIYIITIIITLSLFITTFLI